MLSADAIFIMRYIVLCSIAKLKSVDINKSIKMFIYLYRLYRQIQDMMSVNTNHYSISDNFLTNSTRFFLLLQFTSGRWGTDTSGFTSKRCRNWDWCDSVGSVSTTYKRKSSALKFQGQANQTVNEDCHYWYKLDLKSWILNVYRKMFRKRM